MSRNRQSSWSIPVLLVALGLLALSSQAQLPTKRISRFGAQTDARATRFAPPANNPGAVAKQAGVSLSFGIVDFPRSPDSTAFGVNSKRRHRRDLRSEPSSLGRRDSVLSS